MINKEVTCILCIKNVSIDNMRADKSAKGWICPNCYEKQHYKRPLKSITKDFRNVGTEYKTIPDQQNMVKPKINIKQKKNIDVFYVNLFQNKPQLLLFVLTVENQIY